jgi:hypothetical protein
MAQVAFPSTGVAEESALVGQSLLQGGAQGVSVVVVYGALGLLGRVHGLWGWCRVGASRA